MKHPVSQELYEYWNRLRGSRAAPERADLDPGAIREILADTFLADIGVDPWLNRRTFTISLAGTRLSGLWGRELRGMSLPSLWRAEDQASVREILSLVLDDQFPRVVGATGRNEDDAMDLEALLLPLRHHGKTHARLLGSIVPHGGARFRGLQPVGGLALTSFRTIEHAPWEAPAGAAPTPVASRRYGRFTVYDGGRRADGRA